MASWMVDRDGHRLIITATEGGPIRLDVEPPGEPLVVDADKAQDIRLKIGAAIAVARGGDN